MKRLDILQYIFTSFIGFFSVIIISGIIKINSRETFSHTQPGITEPQLVLKTSNSLFGIKVRVIDVFSEEYIEHGDIVSSSLLNVFIPNNFSLKYRIKLSSENFINSDLKKSSVSASLPDLLQEDKVVTDSFILALDKAGRDGVKIVNYSMSGSLSSIQEEQSVSQILNKYDMLLVVSAGNHGSDTPEYPCAYKIDRLICVGSFEKDEVGNEKHIAYDSNYGPHVMFYGDGKYNFNGEKMLWGTSFATPRVVAALVMILSNRPEMRPKDALKYLKTFGQVITTEKVALKLQKD